MANENPVFTEFRPVRLRNDYNGNWMSETEEEPAKVTDIQLFKVSAALSKKMVGDNIKHISEFFSTYMKTNGVCTVKFESGQQDVCCLMYPTGLKS